MECKNCQTSLSETADYCYNCGGKIIRKRLTMRNLFDHFSETFFNYDNKFFQTFISLFRKPEEVISTYINGTRKKYVNVVSYFAIALTISGLQVFILNKFFPDIMNLDVLSPKGMEAMQKENMSFAQEYQSLLYMLAVPFYALISKLVFLSYKKYNYTEHIVINMYMSAHFAMVSAIFVIVTSMIGINFILSATIIIILQLIYSAYVFKQLYRMTTGGIILKSLLFLGLLIIIMILFSIFSAIMMFINDDFKEAYEAGKAAKSS